MALAQTIAERPRKFLPLKSVLIVTDTAEPVQALGSKLHTFGYNTVTSQYSGDRLKGIPRQTPDAIIIQLTSYQDHSHIIADALRNRYNGKNIPIIGIFTENSSDQSAFDSVLMEPVFPTQVAHRVSAMIRMSIMQTEIALRLDTLYEDFGIEHQLQAESFNEKLKVLFIGKATPEFMVIINALEQKNVEVVAAFTSFTAFDFLHDFVFDAVVMNALGGMEPGLTIAQTMRKNSSLYHTPSLLLAQQGQINSANAYEHGVSDIIYADTEERDIQDRILELARYHRLHRQVKNEFDGLGHDSCMDVSGVYNSQFFSKHISRLIKNYSAQDLPVSVFTIEANFSENSTSKEKQDQALNELGRIIKNLVRVYDVTARISRNIFVIAFPGQPTSALDSVVERISAIPATTQLMPDDENGIPQNIHLKIDSTELGHGVTGESWLAQQLAYPS